MVLYSVAKDAVHEGNLILVNQTHPLRKQQPQRKDNMAAVDVRFPQITLKRNVTRRLNDLFHQIGSGKAIVPVSGFRSLREQTELYDTSMRDNGEEYTKKFVAKPNESEHQTGMAIDVAEESETIDFICPEFSYQGIALKFREEAARFGFIERYPKGKESITGIAHEPWHFRYVGTPHSRIITMLGMALEEYLEYLKHFPYHPERVLQQYDEDESPDGFVYQQGNTEYRIYYIEANEEDRTMIALPMDCEADLSGNNSDGFILTLKKENKTTEKVSDGILFNVAARKDRLTSHTGRLA